MRSSSRTSYIDRRTLHPSATEDGGTSDTGHTHLGGFIRRFIDLAGDRLVHVHAHDNGGRYDDHLAPGDGAIDWPKLVRALDDVHYAEWIILDLTCPGHPMIDAFRRAWQQSDSLFNRVPLSQ